MKSSNFILLAALLIGLSELDFIYSGLRYLKYLLLPLAIFVMMNSANWQENIKDRTILAFFILVVWSFITGLINVSLDSFGLKDLFFIIVYVVSLLAFSNNRFNVNYLFYIFSGLTVLSFPSYQQAEFSIIESSSPFESTSCFAFAAFYIYFLITRNNIHAVISLILVFLTLKRIVLPPILLATIFCFSGNLVKNIITSRYILYTMSFIIPLVLIFLTLGTFDELIEITTGRNANWITLGRTSHYQGVIDLMYQYPFKLILGNGIGSSYLPSASFYDTEFFHVGNLHSDFLKILFELGVIFYIFFFYNMIKASNRESRLFLLLLFSLYATDNVLIYSGVSFVILSLAVRARVLNG